MGPFRVQEECGVPVAGEIASKTLELSGLGEHDGRIVGRVVNAGFDEGLEIYSVYLIDNLGLAGENLEIWGVLGAILFCSRRPWIVRGD
eukprot:2291751-Pyramimonas_sp.AAC.1